MARRARYYRVPWWQVDTSTTTIRETTPSAGADAPGVFQTPATTTTTNPDNPFETGITTTTGVPTSTTGQPPVSSPNTSFTTTTNVPLPSTTTSTVPGEANEDTITPPGENPFQTAEGADKTVQVNLLRDLYLNDPTYGGVHATEDLEKLGYGQEAIDLFLRSWYLARLRGEEADNEQLMREEQQRQTDLPPTDPEVFETRVITMLQTVFGESARQHNLPYSWGETYVTDNWDQISSVILPLFVRDTTVTRWVPTSGLSPVSGNFEQQEATFPDPDQPELNSLDLIDQAVSYSLYMLTGVTGNPLVIPNSYTQLNEPQRLNPIDNTWDLAVTWPLAMAPEDETRPTGSRSARDQALSALDLDQLTEQANSMYQRYLLQGAPDARSIAEAYHETVGGNPDQRLDYQQFVLNRIRQEPAYSYIYANKPAGSEELDYLNQFYQTWIGQFGATDQTLKQVKGFANTGATQTEMQEAAQHNPQTTRSQGFMEDIGDRFQELGDILAP